MPPVTQLSGEWNIPVLALVSIEIDEMQNRAVRYPTLTRLGMYATQQGVI